MPKTLTLYLKNGKINSVGFTELTNSRKTRLRFC